MDEHAQATHASGSPSGRLAREVTDLVHGAGGRRPPRRPAEILFGADPRQASPRPSRPWLARCRWPARRRGGLSAGVALGPVLQRAGLAASQGDARRQLEQGGVSVNGEKAAPERPLGPPTLLHGRWVLLRKGKKGWAVVDLASSPGS